MALMTVEADSTTFRFGTQALKCTTGTTGDNAIYPSTAVPVVPGEFRAFSVYIKTNAPITGGSIYLRVAQAGLLTPVLAESAPVTDSSVLKNVVDGFGRLILAFVVPAGVFSIRPFLQYSGSTGSQVFWLDGIKLETGDLASEWVQPFASEQVVHDQMGSLIDASVGGIFRLRGSAGGARDTVSLGANGLLFGGDTNLYSPAAGTLAGPTLLDLTTSGTIVAKAPVVTVWGTSGSPHTWTKPAGIHHIIVECIGGGGAGGGAFGSATAGHYAHGAGGGGGGYARKVLTAAQLTQASYTATTGAGGTVGAAGNNPGNDGNDSTFAGTGLTSVVGGKGLGGGGGADSTGVPSIGVATNGVGGTATGGDINVSGADADRPLITSLSRLMPGGGGAGAVLGRRHIALLNAGTGGAAGAAGVGYGGGGDGGYSNVTAADRTGGAGADGVVIVTEFYGP